MSDLTLEVVEEAFQQWREQRNSRSELIPHKLWDMLITPQILNNNHIIMPI
jgi:hypothetical protein